MRQLAIVLCLAVTGSVAHAGHHRKPTKKVKPIKKPKVAEPVDVDDDAQGEALLANARVGFASHHRSDVDDDVAIEDEAEVDAPVKLRKAVAVPPARDWHVAIGPYLWASSVDANVSLGSSTVGAGVDFIQLEHHAQYGAEVLGEVRYDRFSFAGDLMYGVVAVDGGTSVGPVMVTANGSASSLLIDGLGGYQVYGDDHSVLSLEARGGARYQRTAVSGSIGVAGSTVNEDAQALAGVDALAGGHVVVRPLRWLFASSAFDVGVFGASRTTWSASADASVQLGSHLLLSLGYRTLTMQRTHVELVLHGPRAALQLTW